MSQNGYPKREATSNRTKEVDKKGKKEPQTKERGGRPNRKRQPECQGYKSF